MSPQHVSKLVEELRKRGAPSHEIQSFEKYCATLPESTRPPCPFCYVANRRAGLAKRTEVAGLAILQCESCDVSVVVRM